MFYMQLESISLISDIKCKRKANIVHLKSKKKKVNSMIIFLRET